MRTTFSIVAAAAMMMNFACAVTADDTPAPTDTPTTASSIAAKSDPSESSETPQRQKPIADQKDEKKLPFPLKFGMETMAGVSNVPGYHRYSDGMWAGSGTAYPSVGYFKWDNGTGQAGKVSIGIGKMYTGTSAAVEQPVEAWWQAPASKKASVTVGKFWVPFAAQEWQYETKPGAMLNWQEGRNSVAFSANYNLHTHGMNGYWRAGRDLGHEAAVGLSFGLGRGLSYDSIHDKAWGLDATVAWNGFRLSGEYVGMVRHSSDAFGSTFGKLQYEKLGAWKPFVSVYSWNDRSGQFGRFRSTVYGTAYQITPMLAVETAYAPTSNRRVQWLQLRWAWER
jgi:hypothetical protein